MCAQRFLLINVDRGPRGGRMDRSDDGPQNTPEIKLNEQNKRIFIREILSKVELAREQHETKRSDESYKTQFVTTHNQTASLV